MPDIDKMSLKELRAMLKEKRKTTQTPVSKMKKGALMKELITNSNLLTIDEKHQDAPDVYSKKTANQILEKSQVDKQYVPLVGYKYGAEEIDRPGAKQFSRMTGKKREAKGVKEDKEISNETFKKQSMKQTEQPGSARAISDAMTVKSKRGRPPKNAGMGVGSDKEVPSSLAPPQLVLSRSQSYEQQQMKPNLTRLEKPMKYGGGYVDVIEPKGQVAKQVVKIEEKKKKVLSAEHLAKMKAGREKAKKEKENK